LSGIDEPGLVPPNPATDWIQYNLAVREPGPSLYRTLGSILDEALMTGTAEDGFFVHKPPGVRFRLRSGAVGRPGVAATVDRTLAELSHTGQITDWCPAVYEPEQRLYGGPVSMRSVHRVFTVDSVAWLRYYGLPGTARRPGAAVWALSLLMIRALFDALEIVGWEHIDVWDRLGSAGGRLLSADAAADRLVRPLGRSIRAGWDNPGGLRSGLSAEVGELLADYERAVRPAAASWRSGYFTAPGATVGPRQAAAYAVIFHWNRAALPLHHQALITHVLAAIEDLS